MKIAYVVSVFVLSLGLSLTASAKQYRLPLANSGVNADGNYVSRTVNKGFEGQLVYELVAATPAAETFLSSNKCKGAAIVDASVLSSHQEFDNEAQKPGLETVKLLVRQIDCAGIVPTR